jgi:CheY-like chemotaxis protein
MNSEGLPPISYRISADYGVVQVANTNDLFGSTVNICAKINRMARPDGMVIGADLYRIVNASRKYHFKEVSAHKIDKKFQYSVYAVQRVDNRAAVAAHISPVVASGDRPRVMLVDDEDDVLATYRMFLSNCGYFIDAFNDAEQALASFAKSKQYALVVLDIRMPNINGLQLFQRMKAINSKTSIMFVTALDAIDEIKTILPDSETAVIRKPVAKEQFISKVNSLVGLA